MRSLVTFFGGALSVGLVVGVLALAGVIDDDAAPYHRHADGPAAVASHREDRGRPGLVAPL